MTPEEIAIEALRHIANNYSDKDCAEGDAPWAYLMREDARAALEKIKREKYLNPDYWHDRAFKTSLGG